MTYPTDGDTMRLAALGENRDHWARLYIDSQRRHIEALTERDRARDLAATYLAELLWLKEHGICRPNPDTRIVA